MISFKLSELALRLQSSVQGEDIVIKRVSTNSKDCKNSLFIPLKGLRFDGHDFIDEAVSNGAAAVVSQKEHKGLFVPFVLCADTLRAYGMSGLLVREKSQAKICSITGSCGKTTVKEMTAAILSVKGKTLYTKANFNNDVGVPKTLLELEDDTRYAVIEQGASHLLDIKRTCEFISAPLALITNVGIAHIEGFGSKDNVYYGKSEILDEVFLRDGIGIVPADSPYFEKWLKDYEKEAKKGSLISFGLSDRADIRAENVISDAKGLEFTLCFKDEKAALHLNLLGRHNAVNAAAAAALALSQGFTLADVKKGLEENYKVIGQRLNIVRTSPFTLIDDAYNASFNAVIAAVDTLSAFDGYRIFIFADMKELGAEAEECHRRIGEYCQGRVDLLLCYGPLSLYSKESFGKISSRHFNLKEDLLKYVRDILPSKANATVLVKGSHSMGLDEIVSSLMQ